MADSPTTRTLKLYRKHGYEADVVEKWNPHARIRQDLFGVVDIVAIGGPRTIALQATSGSGHSARVKKICAEPRSHLILASDWEFLVISWTKRANGRYRWRHTQIHAGLLTTPAPVLEITTIPFEGP